MHTLHSTPCKNNNLQSKATDNLLFWVIGNKLRQLLGKIQKKYPEYKIIILNSPKDKKTILSIMKIMKENNIIYEVNNKFYIDPKYFSKGKRDNDKSFTRVFFHSIFVLLFIKSKNPTLFSQVKFVFVVN